MQKRRTKIMILATFGVAIGSNPTTQHAILASAVLSSASSAIAAENSAKMNAYELLTFMRGSLAEIAFSLSEAKINNKRRSGVLVLAAVDGATKAVQKLELALHSRSSVRISQGTKALSKAVGELQTRYALSSAKSDEATIALHRFNAAWSEYSSRFILSKPKSVGPQASDSELRALRGKVADLSIRMQQLEDDMKANAALRSEIGRMRREISISELPSSRGDEYQRLSFTITVLSGSLSGFLFTTKEYYPQYYVRVSEFERVRSIDGYWDGYYRGYYDAMSEKFYRERFVVTDPIVFERRTEIYQDVSYQTIYDVTHETTSVYETLPKEDFSNVVVAPLPLDVDFSMENVPSGETQEFSKEQTSDDAKGLAPGGSSETTSEVPPENELDLSDSPRDEPSNGNERRDNTGPQIPAPLETISGGDDGERPDLNVASEETESGDKEVGTKSKMPSSANEPSADVFNQEDAEKNAQDTEQNRPAEDGGTGDEPGLNIVP